MDITEKVAVLVGVTAVTIAGVLCWTYQEWLRCMLIPGYHSIDCTKATSWPGWGIIGGIWGEP